MRGKKLRSALKIEEVGRHSAKEDFLAIAGFLTLELKLWCLAIVSNLPGSIGMILRRKLFEYLSGRRADGLNFGMSCEVTGHAKIRIGKNFSMMRNCSLHAHNAGVISIEDNVSCNSSTVISASDNGEVVIGNDVIIGQNCVIRASDHEHQFLDQAIRYQGHIGGKIVVGKGVWIGANSVVTRNVTIGEHSIVAAGAVVTRDIPSFCVAAGVPARVIRKRSSSIESKLEI